MNKTEAWEVVYGAAFGMLKASLMSGHGLTPDEQKRLAGACKLVRPNVERMRQRLDDLRDRRAGQPKRPKWAAP